MNIQEEARKMKLAAPRLAASVGEVRSAALLKIATALEENRDAIFAANAEDLAAADEAGISKAVKKRLLFDEGKLASCLEGLRQLAAVADGPLRHTAPALLPVALRSLDKGLDARPHKDFLPDRRDRRHF